MLAFAISSPETAPLKDIFTSTLKDDFEMVIFDFENPQSGGGDFQSPSWYHAVQFKSETIYRMIRDHQGESILYLDIDIQFFRPCKEVVLKSMEGKDVVFQSEYWPPRRPFVNTGFIGIHCNPKSLGLWEQLMDSSYLALSVGDQTFINQRIEEGIDLEWGIFPHEIWCYSQSPGNPPKDIILHHANCTGGSGGIKRKLQQFEAVRKRVDKRLDSEGSGCLSGGAESNEQ